jgi:hypothetical protein
LAEHVERAVTSHHGCLKQAMSSGSAGTPSAASPVTITPQPPPAAEGADQPAAVQKSVLVARIRQRYATIRALQASGDGLREIARQLNLDRKTVRRFAQATSAEDLVTKALDRDTLLDSHKPYLHQRWNEGCHDIPQLHRELREQGFIGDVQSVRRYFRPFKKPHSPRPKHPSAPRPEPRPARKPRRVVRWIVIR